MLKTTTKVGEPLTLEVAGVSITFVILSVKPSRIQVAIDAPKEVKIRLPNSRGGREVHEPS